MSNPEPQAPGGVVLIVLPGATAASATVAMQMPNGKPVPIGVANPTTGTFAPTNEGFMAWWKTLPTVPPADPDQPWNNGGTLSVT